MAGLGHVETERSLPAAGERDIPAEETTSERRVGHRVVDRLLRHPLWSVAAVATASRLVAVIALGPTQEGVAVPDEIQYLELADSVAAGRGAEAWFPGYGQSLYDSTATLMRPLVALTWVFGSHQVVGQLLVAVFGVLAAVLTAVLAAKVVRPPAALAAGMLAAVFPSQVYWSSVVLRESMIWAALALLALSFGRAKDAGASTAVAGWGVVAFACLYALGDLRQLTAVIAGFCLVLAATVLGGPRRWAVLLGATVISLVAPLLTGLGPFGYSYVEGAAPQLATIRANLSLGAASSIVDTTPLAPAPAPVGTPSPGAAPTTVAPPPDSIVVRTPSGEAFAVEGEQTKAFSGFPEGLVAVTLRPFPWEPAPNAGVLLAKVENIAWAILYLLAVVGAIATWSRRRWMLFPTSFVVIVLAAAAVSQGNLGTAFRHRGQVFWVIAILSVAGVQWLVDRRTARRS